VLSRVGHRLFWIGRYVERAESSARLIRVYSDLFLDLPRSSGMGWRTVLAINGVENAFAAAGGDPDDETAIVRFLLADEANSSSLLNALAQARENARVTRDIIPMEAWRVINKLYLTGRDKLPGAAGATKRRKVLDDIVRRCQLFAGLMAGTMSHGNAYQFARMGWHLERGDMTTRIIDVAAGLLMSGREELKRFDNTLWMTVLRSLSGYQMYRQYARRRITAPDVIDFLMTDPLFPRSVKFCLTQVENAVQSLPRVDECRQRFQAIHELQEHVDPGKLDPAALHEYIDQLQLAFASLNDEIFATWFAPADVA
jgi:uncharacterized alpha-E superfamily protein